MDVDMACQGLVCALVVLKVVAPTVRALYNFFLRPGKSMKKYGAWAVVTGATDGIGEALAFELAAKGMNIFLISRTEAKLVDTAKALQAKFPKASVAHLAVDFAGGFDASKRAAVAAALRGLDVGVLVNNVGMSYGFTKYYHELTEQEPVDLISINLESTMHMTKIVLGDGDSGMIARKRGAIINTSSAAGTQISPLLAGYSAAKGGIVAFSKSLHAELKPKGIDVQVHTPLFVVTKLAKIRKASLTVPTPKTYAKAAVKAIGYGAAVSPYWAHALQLAIMDALPEFLAVAIVSSMHHTIRKKGMKKEKDKASSKKAQ